MKMLIAQIFIVALCNLPLVYAYRNRFAKRQAFTSVSFKTAQAEREESKFVLHPHILAVWSLFILLPLTFCFISTSIVMSLSVLYNVYDQYFSKPEWARSLSWRMASEDTRMELLWSILGAIVLVVIAVSLFVYVRKLWKAFFERKIEITDKQIIYMVNNQCKSFSITDLSSFNVAKGRLFADIEYSSQDGQTISLEFVKKKDFEKVNRFLQTKLH